MTRPHAHDTHTHTCARVWEMLCTHTTRANTARTRTNHIFFTHGDRTLRSDASTRQMSRQRPGSGLQRPLRCSMAPPAPFTHPPPASGGTDLHNEDMQGGKWGVMRGSDAAGGRKPVSRRVNEHITAKNGRAEARPGAFERQRIIPQRMPRAPLRSPRHHASAPCDCTRGRASAHGCQQSRGVVAPLSARRRGPDDRRLSTEGRKR